MFSQSHRLFINKPPTQYTISSFKLNGFSEPKDFDKTSVHCCRVEVVFHTPKCLFHSITVQLPLGKGVCCYKNAKKFSVHNCNYLQVLLLIHILKTSMSLLICIYAFCPKQCLQPLSVATSTLRSPDLLFIISGNRYFSQAVPDSGFKLWLEQYKWCHQHQILIL